MFTCTTNSPEETAHLAELVGQKIREGTVLCLEGDLGAGKTLFVQSLAHTLGVEGEVTSPTFNLMNVYEGICPIYHFDLYRLETEEELEDMEPPFDVKPSGAHMKMLFDALHDLDASIYVNLEG